MKNRIIKNIVFISLFVSIMVVCSWVTIPFTIPFTLQTFGVFSALLILGSKRGTISICIYIILGIIGLPVFSGFGGGLTYLVGPTGGFIIGFIFMGIISIIFECIFKNGKKIIPLTIGLFICYIVGLLWMSLVTKTFTLKGIIYNSLVCVIPFIVPDIIKLWLAFFIKKRIKLEI